MSLDGLFMNVQDETDVETLYILIGADWAEGMSELALKEKHDCPMTSIKEAIKYRKKLYPQEK